MPTLVDILKTKIRSDGKSKASVAAYLKVTERTIENYMNGKREPKLNELIKLSKFLEFSLSELTGEVQNVPNMEDGDYKDRYINLLEKENERLSSSVETNLILIRKYSEVLVAWVEAFAGSAPAHLSKNSEEAASWLQDIHKRLVDNLPPHAKGDIFVGSLSRDKKPS